MPGARIERGERVTLRTVENEDIPFLQRASANPEIRYPIGNPVQNREQIEIAVASWNRSDSPRRDADASSCS